MKTTFDDIGQGPARVEEREYERGPTYSRVGRSFYMSTCPFCGEIVECFVWSMAGHGGKRCSCGAMLCWTCKAYRVRS